MVLNRDMKDKKEIRNKVIDKIIEYTKELIELKSNPYPNDERGFIWEHTIGDVIDCLEELKKK
jgi:hypothetical protein